MTSVNFSRGVSRRWVRTAGVGLLGVLVLTACGAGDGLDDDSSPTSGTSSSAAVTGGGSGGTSSSASSAAGDAAGNWLATTKGQAVALLINDDEAGLFATGGSVCSGSVHGATIRLKCSDKNKERAEGTIESVGRTSMKVRWESSLGTETYTRSEGGRLPSGFPTAGLGS
ncbi:hypothetical protein ABZ896_02935 [Streptomyces sp. NPDC047072]|uniref:hypothetical protein n=1 Tax=Streptomyces sp. NPDC047072 TaxID=3154809 RepID=UPI0033D1D2BB